MQAVPLRVNEAGGGLASVWLPTNPKLMVLPPFAARVAFQVLPETASVATGKLTAKAPG